ncbi:MAG: biopolymer transporter ExbD [Pseudomonadota bacterium]
MRPRTASSKREPVISLINIVFLILIFFMVAGSLSGRDTSGISFVETRSLEVSTDPDAVIITAEGGMRGPSGAETTLRAHIEGLDGEAPDVKLLPDRALPAETLLALIEEAQAAGAGRILIVTLDAGP